MKVTRVEAAALAGVAPDTFSAYVSRGRAPQPVEHVGSTPLWSDTEIRAWLRLRPGRAGRPASSSRQ